MSYCLLERVYCRACLGLYVLPRVLPVAARVLTRVLSSYMSPRLLSRTWLHDAARILRCACCHAQLSLFARVLSMLPRGGAGVWPRACRRVLGIPLAKRLL